MDTIILAEDQEYDHLETQELLESVRNLFQKRLKIAVPEWVAKGQAVSEKGERNVIEVFIIKKSCDPIYCSCNGGDDLTEILSLFEQRLNGLLDNLDAMLDNNRDLDEESKRSLGSYVKAVEKCVNVYNTQKRKRMSKFKELLTVDELRDELRQLFSEIIANYIIRVLFDALYERVKNNAGQIYKMVINEINQFLSQNGVYTKAVSEGDRMNPEYMEATQDSSENFTDDHRKFETIDKIYRYPYLFDNDAKIIEGCARMWRKRD